MNAYILAGPADCGNICGYWKKDFVPDGKFVIVEDGEYANGGYGPSVISSKLCKSWEAAAKHLAALTESEEISGEDLAAAADYFDNLLWRNNQID